MNTPRQITTDKSTFSKYVKAGLWKPNGEPKFHKAGTAVVSGQAKLKPKRGDDEIYFVDVVIYIQNYYTSSQVAQPRL